MPAHGTAIDVFEPEYTDAFIEIRAQRADKDAEVFADELLQMYQNFSHEQGWSTEIVLRQEADHQHGEVVLLKVMGEDAYTKLKYETGRHRVQRIPASEPRGQMHTSTASVVVTPIPGERSRLEVIRTYNFPDDEVRDHRHKVKASGVRRILAGRLDLILSKFQGETDS